MSGDDEVFGSLEALPRALGLREALGEVPHGSVVVVVEVVVDTFNDPRPPGVLVAAFRNYYGPTMNAFEAAEKNGGAADLQKELVDLFDNQNQNATPGTTSIPATFLRVTVRA